MSDDFRISHGDLVTDLAAVRLAGVGKLRRLDLPALSAAARLGDFSTGEDSDTSGIRVLLKEALDNFGGGSLQEAAEYSLGLYAGTALWSAVDRRREAAALFGVVPDTFRKGHEQDLLNEIAEHILVLCQSATLRRSRLAMQERRHPADSRLAVQWVERFEAYYRIWTPAYALAADLEAAIETWREEPSEHPPWAPDSDEHYDRDHQAAGYGHSALYWLASFGLEVKRFRSRHGGLWLHSDSEVEQQVADAVYRIGWHNDLSDRDESFLRRHLADARHEEPGTFWGIIQAFPQAVSINGRWQQMILDGVACTTDEDKAKSQVWLTIEACRDYCRLIDEDWARIADWYQPGSSPKQDVSGATLYQRRLGMQANGGDAGVRDQRGGE